MGPRDKVAFAVAMMLGLLLGSGLGALAFGGQLAQLRVANHHLQESVESLNPNVAFGSGDEITTYPTTLEEAKDEGYTPTFFGRCEQDAGYHYTRTNPGYDGPRLLFGADGTFLGYKFQAQAPQHYDLGDPWQWRGSHPGSPYGHWDLYAFVRDPAGACR